MNQSAILLVEDNDDDAELTESAFSKLGLTNPLVRTRDGKEALEYVLSLEPSNLPALILLDLNLPGLSGLEVLSAIRSHPRLRYLPVVVLTSSDEESDRLGAYQRAVNSYVRKPVNYDQFLNTAREMVGYWLRLNRPAPQVAQ